MKNFQEEKSHTIREIEQQPALWIKAIKQLSAEKEEMDAFLKNIETKHNQVRVIFTGAGTSAFVGETLFPHIRREISNRGWETECISTTNLTATPGFIPRCRSTNHHGFICTFGKQPRKYCGGRTC